MPGFRHIFKRLIYFPISPAIFRATVSLMRTVRFLRLLPLGESPAIKRVFVSYPYSRVGDLVLLLPLLETIQQNWPESVVDVAVGAGVADLLLGVNGLGRVFLFNPSQAKLRIFDRYSRIVRAVLFYRKQIMENDYDLAIVPRWGSVETYDSIYLAYLTGAPQRCGYSASVDGGDTEVDALLTKVATGGSLEPEALRNVRLLTRTGLMRRGLGETDFVNQPIQSLVNLSHMGHRFEPSVSDRFPRPEEKYAVISPGATKAFCIWPMEHMVEFAREFSREVRWPLYVVGNVVDASLCEELERQVPGYAISLGGKTTLPQLVGLLSNAQFFLGNDSGTAHLAGALGIPTVVVHPFPLSCQEEHPNSPSRFRPCGPLVQVVQPERTLAPCYPTCGETGAHCIRQIQVSQVLDASVSLLRGSPGFSPGRGIPTGDLRSEQV
jgi:ADP-heptose:LPS heptosyltransferase